MSSFRSVYGIFVLDLSVWTDSLQLCLPFYFHLYQCGWSIQERMMLLFLERVFILPKSLVMRGLDEFLFCRT